MEHIFVFLQANVALFEARCKEKIQQFEDAGSDEDDIWDEKDVTFAAEAQRRPRSAAHVTTQICLPTIHFFSANLNINLCIM